MIKDYIILFFCLIISACQTNNTEKYTKKPDTIEIAILLPMSGEKAQEGQEYNKLIKLGLENALSTYVHVTSYDAADEKQTRASMAKIIQKNTKIILGPLYSNTTSLIAEQAKNHNIITLTMSNDPALADDKLFVFGHAPLKQLESCVDYYLEKNYNNFIALLPNKQYSKAISKIIQARMIPKSGLLHKIELYESNPEAIDKAVATISNDVDNLNEIEDYTGKPVIYLSDDTQHLNLLFNSLHKYQLDKKAIITGDNRIDIDYSYPMTIYFTGSLNMISSDLKDKSQQLGIYHLSFMHLVAYDLGRLTAKYIGEQFTEERFLSLLNSKTPYIGMSGNIYFTDSIAQRKYDIIKKENGKYSTIHSD